MVLKYCSQCGSPLGDSGICGLCQVDIQLVPSPSRQAELEALDALTVDGRTLTQASVEDGWQLPPAIGPAIGYQVPYQGDGSQGRNVAVSPHATVNLGSVALVASVLLVLSISLPSITTVPGESSRLWTFGYVHLGYTTLRAAAREHRYPAAVWWIAITVASSAVSLIVGGLSTAVRGAGLGWVLVILGALAAIGAPVTTHLAHLVNGVGVWTTIAGGCLVAMSGVSIVATSAGTSAALAAGLR
jgi:hypothetical protein